MVPRERFVAASFPGSRTCTPTGTSGAVGTTETVEHSSILSAAAIVVLVPGGH
jgi:hypothetical protein